MAEPIKLRVRDLLYRSRGRDWDYAFLLQPEPLVGEGWYALHRRIFANVEPGPEPLLLRGALGIGQGQPFFATAFTDGERCDSQGRDVAHYLVWLGQQADEAAGVDFGPGVVEALAPALDAVFDLSPQALQLGETAALDSLLRRRFQAAVTQTEISLTPPLHSLLRWLGTIPA
jgi:hypothetical protein